MCIKMGLGVRVCMYVCVRVCECADVSTIMTNDGKGPVTHHALQLPHSHPPP